MTYVNHFVLPVPQSKLDEYFAIARKFAAIMKAEGALHYSEAAAEDVPHGQHTDFYRAVDAQDGETVVVGIAIWRDKAAADAGMLAAMAHPDFKDMKPENMPMDGKRMFWGGFATVVDMNEAE